MKSQRIGNFTINYDDIYYITYAGGKRPLPAKDQKEYDRALSLPWEAQRYELRRIGPDKNPNVVPIKGKLIIEFIKDGKFTPFFDSFFERTHMIQLSDMVVFESMKTKSYEMALRGE
jgi:hypothetical protein